MAVIPSSEEMADPQEGTSLRSHAVQGKNTVLRREDFRILAEHYLQLVIKV
jgi:hypothetical protein